MKFLVDAQLPRRLAAQLRAHGQDATHTLDLPDGNRTTDARVAHTADLEDRIVVPKDADFLRTHYVNQSPRRVLVISTGNMSNMELEALLLPELPHILDAFSMTPVVELTRIGLISHG